MRNTKRDGEVAQAAFVHKALQMGFTVPEPFGDSERFDYVLHRQGKFWRAQVRSTSSLVRPNVYSICSTFKVYHGRGPVLQFPYTENEIDVLAALYGRRALLFNSKNHTKPGPLAQYKDAWHPFFD